MIVCDFFWFCWTIEEIWETPVPGAYVRTHTHSNELDSYSTTWSHFTKWKNQHTHPLWAPCKLQPDGKSKLEEDLRALRRRLRAAHRAELERVRPERSSRDTTLTANAHKMALNRGGVGASRFPQHEHRGTATIPLAFPSIPTPNGFTVAKQLPERWGYGTPGCRFAPGKREGPKPRANAPLQRHPLLQSSFKSHQSLPLRRYYLHKADPNACRGWAPAQPRAGAGHGIPVLPGRDLSTWGCIQGHAFMLNNC